MKPNKGFITVLMMVLSNAHSVYSGEDAPHFR